MRFGFVGPSYTARSIAIADEECINLYAESLESQGAMVGKKSYGGIASDSIRSYLRIPGLSVFSALSGTPRGIIEANKRCFAVVGASFYEILSDGTSNLLGAVANDGNAASLAFNSIQILIVSAGKAYCFTLATSVLLEVTAQLTAVPVKVEYSDSYFIVCFANSNKFQMSQVLDGTTWPGQLVNAVSVFAENIVSIAVNHRELWVFGSRHCQPYQNTGSAEVFDAIPGTLIEMGCAATFGSAKLDNTIFWINEDERGARTCWRAQGYSPVRISTHAIEVDLSSLTSVASLVSYTYQHDGHLFWVLYIPGTQWSWTYDVSEGLWHKRASWNAATAQWGPHWSWNHAYVFGQHLLGDWNSGNLYTLSAANLTDNGTAVRWLRRSPTISDEMEYIYHADLTIDFETGLGPQPPLTDGNGNPRAPQCMLRWSDDRGHTWSNEHDLDCGSAGQYTARAVQRKLGRSRYRVYEVSGTDAISWTIVDAYLRTS